MLIAALVVLAVVTVPLGAGRYSRLVAFRPRGAWLLWLALAVQVLQFTVLDLGRFSDAVHVGTYALAAAFLVVNHRVPGVWLVALGGLCNGLTITLNHGTLPARAAALRAAGLPVNRDDFVNSGVMAHAKLPWLGDVFYVPKGVPLANVFSVGDVLLVIGAFVVVHGLARHAPRHAATPRSVASALSVALGRSGGSARAGDAPESASAAEPATA